MTNNIGVLGCGWLGLPLAKALLKHGYVVHGSTTSAEKITTLSEVGIFPFIISLSEENVEGEINSFLQNIKTLIINIPPKMRRDASEEFHKKIEILIPYVEKALIKNVLFVSSTSVYGNSLKIVTEETPTNPETASGKELVLAENLLQNNIFFKTTILRFGGLIGEDRHPVKFLAGRTNLKDANAAVNLIHREDCIGIICAILQQNAWGKIFNGVHSHHPTRKEYYTAKAIEIGLPLPEFDSATPSEGKQIESKRLEDVLGYSFVKSI